MKTKTLAILTFVLIMTCGVQSVYSGNGEKTISNASHWIPQDFDARNSVLLIENFEFHSKYRGDEGPKVTAEMKDEMKAHYPYKYEFATSDEIEGSDKYTDKDKYRYALRWTHYNGAFDFYILDRKTDNPFPVTSKFSSYVMMLFKPVVATLVDYMKTIKIK